MKVELRNMTPRPEETATWAALISYWEDWTGDKFDDVNREDVNDHLERVLEFGHFSVIEHANFTFSIEGISRVASHQLVRHRLASYTQQSQRYVEIDPEEITNSFVFPNLDKEQRMKMGKHFRNSIELYKELLDDGVPKEDARFVLPQAIQTKIVVTMNARELLHFFKLRTSEEAQWEIREMANQMLEIVQDEAPVIFTEGHIQNSD